MRLLTGFKKKMSFARSSLKESSRQLNNPGCGWYHIYTFKVPVLKGTESCMEKVSEEPQFFDCSRGEQLVLVLIDIGGYRARELTPDSLSYIRKIFEFFRMAGKQMILRFAYDTEGKGMEREPSSISLVKRHMEQSGEVIREYADDVLVMQGVFVGSWGEMHGSQFSGSREMRELINTLYSVTGGSCALAVRTPAQWRQVVGNKNTDPNLKYRLALFNDGIFGSETDLGTYGNDSRLETKEEDPWNRKEELAWQALHMALVPNGGEALWGKIPVGYRQAAKDMQKMHLSYLNSVYHPKILAYWKKEVVSEAGEWNGLSGLDYIGRHLGYRFVIRDAGVSSNKSLTLKIENCGFAGLYEETECILIVEHKDGEQICIRTGEDPRSWKSGENILLKMFLPPRMQKPGEYSLYLQLRRKRDGRILYFANEGAGEKVLLGRFLMDEIK